MTRIFTRDEAHAIFKGLDLYRDLYDAEIDERISAISGPDPNLVKEIQVDLETTRNNYHLFISLTKNKVLKYRKLK